jgi:hypothetical protein
MAEIRDTLQLLKVTDVRDEHDAVSSGDAEQRDEPNDGGDGKNAPSELDAGNPANQGKGQIKHDDH